MLVFLSYGKGIVLATLAARELVVDVLVSLLVAALVCIAVYIPLPTRPYAGLVAVLTFIVVLLLSLL